MPALYHISKWNAQLWYNTGGTRSKKFVQSPEDGKYYYFKQSFKSAGRDYFFEFWSEIIATEIGQLLGFNVLKYDIAIDGEVMGCISESMISDDETLIDGGQYLRAYDIKFDPEIKNSRRLYSFQLIEEALEEFDLSEHIENIIGLIVFDSIIGNGDRHQENWAFINTRTFFHKKIEELEIAFKTGKYKNIAKEDKDIVEEIFDTHNREVKPEAKAVLLRIQEPKSFAPIFDNGSSLGRELEVEKIDRMLRDELELGAYINRGVSEIHWDSDKVTHIELIKKLLETSYSEITEKIIKQVIEKHDNNRIRNIVLDIDFYVPTDKYKQYKLSENRKLLIIKLITLRIDKLKSLLNEGL